MNQPIFVLGCPRSGTTLLARLLADTIYGSPVETHFITKYYKKLDLYGDLKDKRAFRSLVRDILGERPVMQWNLTVDIDQLYESMAVYDYAEIVNRICMLRVEVNGPMSWGDKTPDYLLDVDILYTLFPDSKYIYIVRDGRDVALSLLDREWGPNNVYGCATYWKACNTDHATLKVLRSSGQLYSLRYEDLLLEADRIVPELYRFLGEEENAHDIARLVAEIKPTNSNKWKVAMTPSKIELFERLAGNTLDKFGYETSHRERGVNKLSEAWYRFGDAFQKGLFLVKTNTIDAIKIKYFNHDPFGS